ncbi:MAG: ATP-binding cassette domain-containing protein, partial [Acidimicrobiales bacterium]
MAFAASTAEPSSVPLLLTRDVAVQYGTLRALEGVDLEVRSGEVVALAGENGAGKSTLVRCIAGYKAPSRGEVFVAGRRLAANPAASARSGVAVVWQDLALCDNLDVAANLLLGRERRRLMLSDTRFHAAASRLLAELEIPIDDTSQLVGSLSGGQRQLVAVARAMRDRPRLLILDEPTASLGVNESAQVEELTASLRRQGTTILLVSHDIEQMFRLATRIVVLRHGRVVADVDPVHSHPDEVVAAISGQELDSSARQQLSRLHGLVDRLASADPSSSLGLILSALGAALGTERLCIHLRVGDELRLAAAQGLPRVVAEAWAVLAVGPSGGPVGRAAATEQIVVEADTATTNGWVPLGDPVRRLRIGGSCWSVPVVGAGGLIGVITVVRSKPGRPGRDEQDLVSLYAGYAAGAVERDRLLAQLTARNQVLETIREVLETLAGPVPLAAGLVLALQALRRGLDADEVALVSRDEAGEVTCRGSVDSRGEQAAVSDPLFGLAAAVLEGHRRDGRAWAREAPDCGSHLAVTFPAPMGVTALL